MYISKKKQKPTLEFSFLDATWKIEPKANEELKQIWNKSQKEDVTELFGVTLFKEHKIHFDEDMCIEEVEQTLKHELMHAYLWSIGARSFSQFDEEDICNFSGAASSIINTIVKKYMSEFILYKAVKKHDN